MTNKQLMKHLNTVNQILSDLSDRRGLKQEWQQIDEEIQDEIRLKWAQILHRAYGSEAEGEDT